MSDCRQEDWCLRQEFDRAEKHHDFPVGQGLFVGMGGVLCYGKQSFFATAETA
jgi:hypothetical protein